MPRVAVSGRVARSRPLPTGLFGAVLCMANRRPVFTADYYTVDGGTNKVGAFVDWNDPTHLLAQSAGGSGLQVAVPATHADFGGKLCVDFTGGQRYVSNRTPAQWSHLHDGVSSGQLTVLTPTASGVNVFSTTQNSGNPGLQIYISGNFNVYCGNVGSAAWTSGAGGVATVNGPTYVSVEHTTGVSPQWVFRKKSTVTASGQYTLATSAAAAGQTMLFGANTTAGQFSLNARVRTLMVCTPRLGDAERASMQSWIQQDTGIAP